MKSQPQKRRFLARLNDSDVLINLAGVYDYLELPYYQSQDAELEGQTIRPTCKEILDAYVTPLSLEKAKLAGLPIPPYYISNGYFEPPVVLDPINPYMSRSRVVLHPHSKNSIARSMTRNFTYAICCQELPEGSRVMKYRSVLGWSTAPRFREMSAAVWDLFHIPLVTVRVILLADGNLLFSDLSQLPFEKLKKTELAYIEERVQWQD